MSLKKKYSRCFVSENDDLSDPDHLNRYLSVLRKEDVSTKETLETFILNMDDVFSVVEDSFSRAYVAMTVDTSDEEAEKKYLFMIENISPVLEKASFEFAKRITCSPALSGLDMEKYGLFLKSLGTEIKIFREKNVPLNVEDGKLRQKFQKIVGSWMVKFRGKEITVPEAAKYLFETDRSTRKEAWQAIRDVKEADVHEIEEIYSKMVSLRDRIARNADFENYIDFKFEQMERFDYGPGDCRKFHESVRKLIVPTVSEYHKKRAKDLGISSVRPWDLKVDSLGRAPLSPFKETDRLIDGCATIFRKVDEELGRFFYFMRERELLDLASRKGKAPGGYQTVFAESREPFIFMNAVGTPRDVETLLHEGGHSFHTFLARDQEPANSRRAGHEFSEVASMSMELLTRNFIGEFYTKAADENRYLVDQLYGVLEIFPWVAMMDAFQHRVYTEPGLNAEARRQVWSGLEEAFRPYIDWGDHVVSKETGWHYLHPFEVPLYYIEYGIAQLGALQVWVNSRHDYKQAVSKYKRALSLGGSRSLPALFEAAGAKFDMSEAIFGPVTEELEKELKSIPVGA